MLHVRHYTNVGGDSYVSSDFRIHNRSWYMFTNAYFKKLAEILKFVLHIIRSPNGGGE
jgi:hypothetical protein